MPIVIPGGDDTLLDDSVSIATIPNFYTDTAQATRALRRVAARNAGLADVVEHGTVQEYGSLSAQQQLTLNDEMERLVTAYPASFPTQVVQAAQEHIDNPYFGVPLANTSIWSNLDAAAAGAGKGAAEYLKDIGIAVASGLILYFIINRRNKS